MQKQEEEPVYVSKACVPTNLTPGLIIPVVLTAIAYTVNRRIYEGSQALTDSAQSELKDSLRMDGQKSAWRTVTSVQLEMAAGGSSPTKYNTAAGQFKLFFPATTFLSF